MKERLPAFREFTRAKRVLDAMSGRPILAKMEKEAHLEVLYNGGCPICGAEIAHYETYAKGHGLDIAFTDLQGADLRGWALSPEQATKRLHVRTGAGVISGLAAFETLWHHMPRYRWLARLVGLPGLRWIAERMYNRVLAPLLYHMHLRRQARSAAR